MNIKYLITLVLLAGLSGCAENPVLDDKFGESARSMIYHQIANPDTIVNPEKEPVTGMGGEKGQRILDEYNGNISDPDKSSKTINLNIGGDN